MQMVELKSLQVLESLPLDRWGIPSFPSLEGLNLAKPGEIDLMIMPGLAFDPDLNRIGYGKGYFDRYISKNHPKSKIAICLDDQVLPTVPNEEHDVKVDSIITPGSVYSNFT